MSQPRLTAERLRALLSYDPETGLFTRLVARGGRDVGTVAGSPHCEGYVQVYVDGRNYLAHRLAWLYMTGAWPPDTIDHRNLDKANTRWENLRIATYSQNGLNRPKPANNTTGFKGVWIAHNGRFRAAITIDQRAVHLGYFDTAGDAGMAYAKAATERVGEFARAA